MRIPTISLSNPQSVRKSLLPAPVHVNFLSVAADESLVVGLRNLLRMRLRIQLEYSDALRDASSQRPAHIGFFAYPHSHTAGNSLRQVATAPMEKGSMHVPTQAVHRRCVAREEGDGS